jgi:hypothetical protein
MSMRFPMPHYPGEFEIPDDWLAEAGMADFKLAGVAYRSSNPAARLIPMTAIEPAPRLTSTPKDFRELARRMATQIVKLPLTLEELAKLRAARDDPA